MFEREYYECNHFPSIMVTYYRRWQWPFKKHYCLRCWFCNLELREK